MDTDKSQSFKWFTEDRLKETLNKLSKQHEIEAKKQEELFKQVRQLMAAPCAHTLSPNSQQSTIGINIIEPQQRTEFTLPNLNKAYTVNCPAHFIISQNPHFSMSFNTPLPFKLKLKAIWKILKIQPRH